MIYDITFEAKAYVTFSNDEIRVMMECSAGHYDGRRERATGVPTFKVPLPIGQPQFTKEVRGIGVQIETYTLRSFHGASRRQAVSFYAIPALTDYDCLCWLVSRYPAAQPKKID